MDIKIYSFYVSDSDDCNREEGCLQRYIKNGYEPYMCLSKGDSHSVWAFIRRDNEEKVV